MTEQLKQAAQQAIEVLQHYIHGGSEYRKPAESAITALERALTQRPAAQTEREAFEAWARPNGYDLRRNDVLGHYSSIDTSRAWSGFRAGRATLPAAQQATPALQAVCRYISDVLAGDASSGEKHIARTIMHLLPLEQAVSGQQATPEPEFDDCPDSPSGKHSESWFGNGDCDHCKTGAQIAPMAATPEPVGEPAGYTFVQPVPDKCDRIVWRGQYIHLPITHPALGVPDDIRALGWTVAVHNDYRLNGMSHTFWLFTKDGQALKGEGRTDAEALDQVRHMLAAAQAKGVQA